MEYKYTGIILGKYDVGETDRIYVIYTLEQGKIRTLAKGVRKMHAKLAGQLENFNLVDVLIARNKGMGKIKSAIVENNFSVIKKDLDLLEKAFQMFEIFNRLTEDEQKDEQAFSLLLRYLILLEKKSEDRDQFFCRMISQGFLFQLFNLLGYQIEVVSCAFCGKRITAGGNFFSAQNGGVFCHDCQEGIMEKFHISDSAIKALRIFSSNNLDSLVKLKMKKEEIAELEMISSRFYQWIS
ncbi:MAG: DNA repair protein RecO [Candidatus Moranbacteria bacterium]|jgi:DNA repair protein RecO (recombination protein O)|nr:DNA repair protein RecO [Candidatus Moranbacteria bacterium]